MTGGDDGGGDAEMDESGAAAERLIRRDDAPVEQVTAAPGEQRDTGLHQVPDSAPDPEPPTKRRRRRWFRHTETR